MLRAADESLMRRAWIRLELARLALTRGSDGAEQALLELATVGSSPEALRLRFEAALQLERSEDCLRLIEGGLAVDNERWPALLALAEKSFPKLLRSLDGPVLRRWLEVCVTAPERLQDGLERLAKQCEDFLRETGPRGVSAQPGAPEDLRCMAVAAESVARLRRGGACDESVYEDVIFGVTQSGTVLRFSREQFASVIELMRALHLWFPDRAKPWMTLLECVGRGFPDDLSAEHARSNLETMREAIPGIRSLRDRWIACWRWLFNVWIYESYDMGANKPIELVTLPSDELRGVDQEIMANAWEILCCIDSLRAWHQGSEHWAAEARRAYEKRKALAKGAADWGLRVRLAGLQRIEKKRALWESEVKQLFAELPGSSTTVAAWDCLIFDLLLAAREEGWDLLEDCYQAILGRAGSESVTSFLGNSSLPWSSLQISRTVQLSGLAAAKREFFTKLPPNFKDLPIMKSIAEELGECTSRAGLYWLLARGINGTRKPGF
jgi:hypothetical protein